MSATVNNGLYITRDSNGTHRETIKSLLTHPIEDVENWTAFLTRIKGIAKTPGNPRYIYKLVAVVDEPDGTEAEVTYVS